jgi:hypothetical protein
VFRAWAAPLLRVVRTGAAAALFLAAVLAGGAAALAAPAPSLAPSPVATGSGTSSSAPAKPGVVVAQEQVALVPGSGVWRVLDLLTLVNTGQSAVGQATAWAPPNALDLQAQNGLGGVSPQPDGNLRLKVSLPPGQPTQVGFSYLLPGSTLHLAWHVPVAVVQLVFLVPHGGGTVTGPDFRFAGATVAGPLHLDGYVTDTPSAGSVLDVTVTPGGGPAGGPPVLPMALGGVAVLLVAAAAVAVVRRRRRPRASAPDLVEQIAGLDAAFERQEVAAEEYRARRGDLLDRLLRLEPPQRGEAQPEDLPADAGPAATPTEPAPGASHGAGQPTNGVASPAVVGPGAASARPAADEAAAAGGAAAGLSRTGPPPSL